MARTDAIVLGAGIVGTSIALHLAKRRLSVALFDRRSPGEETSYGNAGVIEGNTLFPHPFPSDFGALLRVAKRAGPTITSRSCRGGPWLSRFMSPRIRANAGDRAPCVLFARGR
jgi:choline dehydrogenase-like flavoprotein